VARGLCTLVAGLSLAAGIYGFILEFTGLALLAAFVLILLYSPKANAFFRSHAV